MTDMGSPISYHSLEKGTPVFSSERSKLGKVEYVLVHDDAGVFDGIVLDTSVLPGGHRFVDAPEVGEIYERGVILRIDAGAAEDLPEPSANPGSIEIGPADLAKGGRDKLRRAWDLISGKG